MEKRRPIIGGIFGTRTEWDENGNVITQDEFHLRIYWDLWHSGAMKKLKGNMLHVYLTIAMHLDQRGEGWPTQERIAELCGINRTTVVDVIKKLIKEGFIEAEKIRGEDGKFKNTVYKIKFAPQPSENDHVEKSDMAKMPKNQGFHHVGKSNMDNSESMSEKPTWKNQHGKSDTKKDIFLKQEPSFKEEQNGIDDDGSANSKEWENDFDYLAFRKRFVDAGTDDIFDHKTHYPRFKEALNAIGFSKLIEYAEQYIAEAKENSQICWFIGGGWKNYLPKTTKKARGQAGKLPKVVAEQLKAEKEQAAGSAIPGSTLSEEELAERRARIQAKIKLMDEKLSSRTQTEKRTQEEDPYLRPFSSC